LAPSLLLSGLLLPLALALLSNTTTIFGRRKREVVLDDPADDASLVSDHVLDTMDSLIRVLDDSPIDTQPEDHRNTIIDMAVSNGLTKPDNQCLEKLACLSAAGSKSTFISPGDARKLNKILKWLSTDEQTSSTWKHRIQRGTMRGKKNQRDCMAELTCTRLKSS